jgi:hypothetical protein
VLFRSIAVPSISQAFRIDTILMRIKATLFVSGAIQFSAFPQRFSTHLINALALHSAHSSACYCKLSHYESVRFPSAADLRYSLPSR